MRSTIGRAILGLLRQARVTCLWLWGAHLQFAPPLLWFSPRRRKAVAAVERVLAEEWHLRQACDEAARDALHAELSEAMARLQQAAGGSYVLARRPAPAPRRRPRAASRPPNRPN
ncbi:hypothetical protein P3T27_003735 [Kitasatospora sp. MAA19]|uniref:hypothetical protein n=1 Tax=unclassified Kitasatospora TaxID=2633591 RepID=UPI002476ED1F|nr:hypothetical protein [Kitasatospora sp. MAA19]MDH6707006.1 hypothetical protein [Kitasatospora sp. MAA19]